MITSKHKVGVVEQAPLVETSGAELKSTKPTFSAVSAEGHHTILRARKIRIRRAIVI